MGLGIYVATRIVPALGRSEEDPQRLLLLGMVILFSGAIIGQVIGLLVGARLRTVLRTQQVVTVDRVGGSVAGAIGVLAAFWFLLPTLSQTPTWRRNKRATRASPGSSSITSPRRPTRRRRCAACSGRASSKASAPRPNSGRRRRRAG